ncbi:MAG: mediator of RNA polymerase II transcription subunit 13 [Trizodia sp. TS-e1964]|nr:MAG: mediator of RNA polymerase II transcription subunit 13 [Trizodia sp. TS-e1964]
MDLRWFLPTKDNEENDPVTFAEQWLLGASNREATIRAKQAARESARLAHLAGKEPKVDEALKEAKEPGDKGSAPAGPLRQISNIARVYPTPPDGIGAHGLATSSLDALGSTPTAHPTKSSSDATADNVQALSAVHDTPMSEPAMHETAYKIKSEQDSPEFGSMIASSLKPANTDEAGNFFAELDQEIFGENRVTDDDFSFFDTPSSFGTLGKNLSEGSRHPDFPDIKVDKAQLSAATSNFPNPDNLKTSKLGQSDKISREAVEGEFTSDYPEELLDANKLDAKETPVNDNVIHSLSPQLGQSQMMENTRLDTIARSIVIRNSKEVHNKSLYEPIVFTQALDNSNGKYISEGRFWFTGMEFEVPKSPRNQGPSIPKIGLFQIEPEPASGTRDQSVMSETDTLEQDSAIDGYSDSTDEVHDGDPSSPRPDSGIQFGKADQKRKRKRGEKKYLNPPPSNKLQGKPSSLPVKMKVKNPNLRRVKEPPRVPRRRAKRFCDCHQYIFNYRYEGANELEGPEFIAIAQILADQVISGTLDPFNLMWKGPNLYMQGKCDACKFCDETFEQATLLDQVFYEIGLHYSADELLADVVTAEDEDPPIKPTKQKSASTACESAGCGIPFTIPSAPVLVLRGESALEVSPPALYFWETFGFSPCSGPKDVISAFILPPGETLRESGNHFLDIISSVYEACRLGKHIRIDHEKCKNGLLQVSMEALNEELKEEDFSARLATRLMKEVCVYLGSILPSVESTNNENFVIYILNPFKHVGSLVEICLMFTELFQAYVNSPVVQKFQKPNEVVLQIIPVSFLASTRALVVPAQVKYTKLAMEVYERCVPTDPNFEKALPPNRHAPSILLAQSLPKTIDFKLTADPSASLLHENSSIHVAYAHSVDGRWISAAWTDDRGRLQMSASYCTARKHSENVRPFEEVAREIWETTLEIIDPKLVSWRVMLVKSGAMREVEIDVWKCLSASTATSTTSTSINMLAVNTYPTILPFPPNTSVNPAEFDPQANSTDTPPSSATKAAHALSPEQIGDEKSSPSSTKAPSSANGQPPVDLDPDAYLFDATDEMWGVVFAPTPTAIWGTEAAGVSQPAQAAAAASSPASPTCSASPGRATSRAAPPAQAPKTSDAPLLARGYLIKRGRAGDGELPLCMEVRLHSASRPYETLLREILSVYAGLSTLARLKGVVSLDGGGCVVPWHIAAAEKAQAALSRVM